MPHASGSCAVDSDDQQLRYSCKRPFLDMAHVGSDCPSASSSGASRIPRVAHCVSGLLRSFTLPMVHRSLLHNFIEPFGGHASIFLVLKTFDTAHKHQQLFPHDANADRVAGWNDATRSTLREALDYVRPQQVRLIHEEPIQINTECRINANLSANTSGGIFGTAAGHQRTVGQLSASVACLNEIAAYEQAHGVSFDLVTRSRPDIAYLSPMQPHCAFNSTWADTVHSTTPGRGGIVYKTKDLLFVMGRATADHFLVAPMTEYRACLGHARWTSYNELVSAHASTAIPAGGFPIGLVRDNYCPSTIHGYCRSVDGHLIQCGGERRCDALLRAGVRVNADGVLAPHGSNLNGTSHARAARGNGV